MYMESNKLIVAVDGGGSTCRVSISDLSGVLLGTARGGSANITTDLNIALANITDAVHRAYNAAGLLPTRMSEDFAYLGLAGANLEGMAAQTESALGFHKVRVTSDREITVQGAMGNDDGTVAAIGTGSFFVSRQKNKVLSIGGWGFQLGDDCGGALLGQKLLRKTIHAHDGLIAHSPLTQRTLQLFGGTPQGMVSFAQTASPMDYGEFAPSLVEAYHIGDTIAIEIIDSTVALVHHMLGTLNVKSTGALYLLGGLGPIYKELLWPEFQRLCVPPKGTALDGAISLARHHWGGNFT